MSNFKTQILNDRGVVKRGKHKGKSIFTLTDTLFLFQVMTQSRDIHEKVAATTVLERLSIYQ